MSELPPGWTEAPLEALVDILDSARVPLNATEREKRIEGKPAHALFPYYGATGQVGEIDDFLFDEPLLLLGEDGVPFFDRLRHKAYLVEGKCWVNNHAHVLRAIDGAADRRYLAGYLNVFDYNSFVTGSTRLKLTQAAMRSIPVSVAPLPEQKRIADKLDALLARVDACRGRLDRVPGILKRFRQSVLAAATSGELTREWREERGLVLVWQESTLGSVGDVTGGITKNAGRANTSLMRRYLRVANVYANRLTLEDVSEIATTPEEFARTRLRAGDVLIVEGNGSVEQIGRAALWRGEIDECAHQNHLIRWRTRGSVMPEFALYWLLSPAGRESLVEFAKSSAGLHTLSLSKVSAVPLLVPPLEEQAEVVRRVGELFQMAERLERRLADVQARIVRTKPSALAKAFRGELVPQDPNDEPASKLLSRLRARADSSGNTGKLKRGGARGPRTKAKADTNMLTRNDVTPTHLTTILKERGSLTAAALWTASQLEIDDFYDQLKDEEARGLLRENRGDSPTAPRVLEAAA